MHTMPSTKIKPVIGIFMAIMCGLVGLTSGFVLSGAGICGGPPLGWGVFFFTIFTAIFPAGTVGFLRAPWWVSPLIFSLPMLLPVVMGPLVGEWLRAPVSIICILAAFGGARALRGEGYR